MTSYDDFKIGDKFKVIREDFLPEYEGIYVVTNISSFMIITITKDGIEAGFYSDEIEKISDDQSEKIIVVNKNSPEFSVKIDCTEKAVKEFFFGTRLSDFYVIKNEKLLIINTQEDIEKIFKG